MVEQGSEQGKYQITPPITSIPKISEKYNPNERSSKEALRDKSYGQGTKVTKKPPKLKKPQTLHFTQDK